MQALHVARRKELTLTTELDRFIFAVGTVASFTWNASYTCKSPACFSIACESYLQPSQYILSARSENIQRAVNESQRVRV